MPTSRSYSEQISHNNEKNENENETFRPPFFQIGHFRTNKYVILAFLQNIWLFFVNRGSAGYLGVPRYFLRVPLGN